MMKAERLSRPPMHDPVELLGITIRHAAEAVAVALFIGMLAVWAAIGCGA